MALKTIDRIFGSIYDYNHLVALPADDCNILFVSSRTLCLLANLAENEVNWHGRYFRALPARGMADVIQVSDNEAATVDQIAQQFRQEVIPVCDDLLTIFDQIRLAIEAIADRPGCGCEGTGTELPGDPESDIPPIGPGEDFPDVPTYNLYKCSIAAAQTYRLIQCQRLLREQFPFGLAGATVVIMTSAIAYILTVSGFSALLARLGAVSNIVQALMTGQNIDLDRVITQLELMQDEIKCALYCAPNADQARLAVTALLVDDSELTELEELYIQLYLLPEILNPLFQYRPELIIAPILADCSDCGCDATPCGFIFTNQGLGGLGGSGEFNYAGLPFNLTSEPDDGDTYHRIWFVTDCATCPSPGGWCIEFVSTTADGLINTHSRTIQCYSCDGGNLVIRTKEFQFDSPSIPADGQRLTVGAMYFNNPVPFEITLRILGPAGECSQNPDLNEECL